MRVNILNFADTGGGAARAAMRLHAALRGHCIIQDSKVIVASRDTDCAHVHGPTSPFQRLWTFARPRIADQVLRRQMSKNPIQHSISIFPSGLPARLNKSDADIINLHWVCNEMLSVEDIARIEKPLIWTLHDSWAFCGAEHHPDSIADERFVVGYSRESRPLDDGGLDLNAWVWRRKKKAWTRPIPLITPSSWLAKCASRSSLMRNWPVTVIPNALPTDTYRPIPRQLARSMFNLPHNAPLLLFGAIGGTSNPIKGWDLLQGALPSIAAHLPTCQAVVVGQSRPASPPNVGMPIHYVGRLSDDAGLAVMYSACDVMLVPSRIENLPQSATEAQACGVPVVAFRVGGMEDAVSHQHTGYLAAPFNIEELVQGTLWTIGNENRYRYLALTARKRAEELWSPDAIATRYLSAYADAIDFHNRSKKESLQ